MYKVKDDVIYKDIKCFIGEVLGDGSYMIITCDEFNVFEVYEKDLEPVDSNRYEVRHVIYDTKDNKVVNDAMGECYITLAKAQEVCDEMNAPKVMKPKYTKEVEYFGMKVLVPDDAKSIATHKDGRVFVSDELMVEAILSWGTPGYLKHICSVDLNGIDWKDTLVEIK